MSPPAKVKLFHIKLEVKSQKLKEPQLNTTKKEKQDGNDKEVKENKGKDDYDKNPQHPQHLLTCHDFLSV